MHYDSGLTRKESMSRVRATEKYKYPKEQDDTSSQNNELDGFFGRGDNKKGKSFFD